MKSCKQVSRNISEMSKELEAIGQVTNVGELPGKLQEVEEAKVEVENQLLERVSKFGCSEHLTLRRLMSYIYGAPILDVSRSHTVTQHSR